MPSSFSMALVRSEDCGGSLPSLGIDSSEEEEPFSSVFCQDWSAESSTAGTAAFVDALDVSDTLSARSTLPPSSSPLARMTVATFDVRWTDNDDDVRLSSRAVDSVSR